MTKTAKVKPPIFKHDVDVVGLGFRMKREFRRTLAKHLPTPVNLVREQTNRYDINAIKVTAAKSHREAGIEKDQHLGYIRAETAEILATLMDCRQDGGFVFKFGTLNELYEDDDNRSGSMTIEFYDYRSLAPTL